MDMCAKLFDESGNTVEALTSEEVEAKLNEVREQTIEETNRLRDDEVTDLSSQVATVQGQLKLAQDDLEKEKNKDKNLVGQRGVIEQKARDIEALQEQIKTLTSTIESKFAEQSTAVLKKTATTFIASLAGGDKNVAEKIQLFYDSFKPIDQAGKTPEQIEEEVRQRVVNAHTIATGGVKPLNPLTGDIISAAGGAAPQANLTGEKLSPEARVVAKEMGITDKDLEKHKLV